MLGEEEYKRLQKVCHRPSAVDDTHPPLRFRQKVRFALSTLETLNTLGFGDEVLDSVMSEISSADYEAVTAVRGFRLSRESRTAFPDVG